ncbi:hypothetical protein SPRG_22192 [Saprolegnia parasitica CBS 223.65]|uniref:Uncharacterized protein n=1 Tax=Saprolegnia parasitica (strain CBS 223.65) TaxID=695850 RepID=A0A067CG23_SAPPC|nr:hypothetical protein SPRG_22192 [Saprolegnia parasitica CBS 223.65]KDO28125.1 hypothetical protein SPRG_22192 [Saprolegnia parasitica CBS 223.65]|eukprot:XP_012201282.1 hypothetical protein SPRG_22192 [Saprolegnia parasitica CBS 223.65]
MESTPEFYRLLLHDHGGYVRSPKKRKPPVALHPLPAPLPVATAANEHIALSPRRLPRLEARVLQRQRVFLHEDGSAELCTEEILQYNEVDARKLKDPLTLLLTRKCDGDDEIPLMPCHGRAHRRHLLPAERWPEPIRDRDKQWSQDELPTIQAHEPHRPMRMTRSATTSGKWHLPALHPELLLLSRRGILIDTSYVIVSAWGAGIYGRVFGIGLQSKRALVMHVYDPALGITHLLSISMDDLEDLFEDHRAYLTAGRKDELLHAITSMLFFEYPDQGRPILHINKLMKTSASKLRRLARAKQRRLEEEERRLAALKFMTMPRRARYRVLCTSHKISSFLCNVSVHHYPHQARNFHIVATHPPSSTEFLLPLGLLYAGKAANNYIAPHTWTPAIKTEIARAVVRQLCLVRNNTGEMALSVAGRVGFYSKGIRLDVPQTPESVARHSYLQSVQIAIQALQQAAYDERTAITDAHQVQYAALERDVRLLEASRSELEAKEAAAKDALDEIEATGLGNVDGLDKDQRHAARQLVRERRADVKKDRSETLVELKRVQISLTALLTQMQAATADETARLHESALGFATRIEALKLEAATPPPYVDLRVGDKRYALSATRSRRPRAFLGMTNQVRQGAAAIEGQRVRYSVAFGDDRNMELTVYAPVTSTSMHFACSLPTWLAVPGLIQHPGNALPRSPEDVELEALNAAIATSLDAWRTSPTSTTYEELRQLHAARRGVTKESQRCVHHLVTALCERLHFQSSSALALNNVLFTMDPYILVSSDEGDRPGVCTVRLEPNHNLVFTVDLMNGNQYEKVHPYTQELVLELASESAQEMQVHLELIASSIQLVRRDDTHADELEFLD